MADSPSNSNSAMKPGTAMSESEREQVYKKDNAGNSPSDVVTGQKEVEVKAGENKEHVEPSNLPRGNDNPNNTSGSVCGSGK